MSVTSLDVKKGGKKESCPVVDAFLDLCNRLEAEGYDDEFIKHALTMYAQISAAQHGTVIEYV